MTCRQLPGTNPVWNAQLSLQALQFPLPEPPLQPEELVSIVFNIKFQHSNFISNLFLTYQNTKMLVFRKRTWGIHILTHGGRYGGRRGKAPNGLLKALSNALWIFSSCLSFFFNLSTWKVGEFSSVASYNRPQNHTPNKDKEQKQWHCITSCFKANFLSLLEAFPHLFAILELPCIICLLIQCKTSQNPPKKKKRQEQISNQIQSKKLTEAETMDF